MKKTIAAWSIAAAAVLGLAACTTAPADENGQASSPLASASAPAEVPASDQSVEDACSSIQTQVADATAAFEGFDMSQAMNDPQGTVDTITAQADAVGAAVESVNNDEVKSAVSAVYEDLVAVRDLFSQVIIEQDISATGDLTAAAGDLQSSAQELTTLCG